MSGYVRVLVAVDDGDEEVLHIVLTVPAERVGGLDRWCNRLLRNRAIRGMKALDALPEFERLEDEVAI